MVEWEELRDFMAAYLNNERLQGHRRLLAAISRRPGTAAKGWRSAPAHPAPAIEIQLVAHRRCPFPTARYSQASAQPGSKYHLETIFI